MDNVNYIQAKTILTRYREPDSWFHIRYSMNLYRGCMHGCIYCDTRSECYGIDDISRISVKENAIDLLKKELPRIKVKDTIGTGSMNDPYMPLEEKLCMTRKALQVISLYSFPVHIITKSSLVLRDIDLIRSISGTFAVVSLTITAADDEMSLKIEPGAPPSSERFRAIKVLRENGIIAGVTFMPVLPGLTDSVENITAIIAKASEAGASYILPSFGVTLRDRQRNYYFSKLKEISHDAYTSGMKYYRGEYVFLSAELQDA